MIPNTGYEKIKKNSMQMNPPPLTKRTEKQVNLNSKKYHQMKHIYFFVVHGHLASGVECILFLFQKSDEHWTIRRRFVFIWPILIAFQLEIIKHKTFCDIGICLSIDS